MEVGGSQVLYLRQGIPLEAGGLSHTACPFSPQQSILSSRSMSIRADCTVDIQDGHKVSLVLAATLLKAQPGSPATVWGGHVLWATYT